MNSDKAKILWKYLCISQKPIKSDVIHVMGSYNLDVARRAAELFNQGYAPYIVIAGGVGRLTPSNWTNEAENFSKVVIQQGAPKEKIITDTKSTNSAETLCLG